MRTPRDTYRLTWTCALCGAQIGAHQLPTLMEQVARHRLQSHPGTISGVQMQQELLAIQRAAAAQRALMEQLDRAWRGGGQ